MYVNSKSTPPLTLLYTYNNNSTKKNVKKNVWYYNTM